MASFLRPAFRPRAFGFPARLAQTMGLRTSARPLVAATQTKLLASRQQMEQKRTQLPTPVLSTAQKNGVLMAAMPQLVPFYFVNEVATTFGVITVLVYLMSKYFLPQTVRAKLARLFISKL